MIVYFLVVNSKRCIVSPLQHDCNTLLKTSLKLCGANFQLFSYGIPLRARCVWILSHSRRHKVAFLLIRTRTRIRIRIRSWYKFVCWLWTLFCCFHLHVFYSNFPVFEREFLWNRIWFRGRQWRDRSMIRLLKSCPHDVSISVPTSVHMETPFISASSFSKEESKVCVQTTGRDDSKIIKRDIVKRLLYISPDDFTIISSCLFNSNFELLRERAYWYWNLDPLSTKTSHQHFLSFKLSQFSPYPTRVCIHTN